MPVPFWRWRREARAKLTPIANAEHMLLTEGQREWLLWLRWLRETGRETDGVDEEMPGPILPPFPWVLPPSTPTATADVPKTMVLPKRCRECALRVDGPIRAYCSADCKTIQPVAQGQDEAVKDACPSWQAVKK